VAVGTEWVTQAELTALNTAITTAETVNGTATATQSAVDSAVTALNGAVSTFNAAKKDGTNADIAAANTFKTTHAAALSLTVASITAANLATNKPLVEAALAAYDALSAAAKALLTTEKLRLDGVKEKVDTFGSVTIILWENGAITDSIASQTISRSDGDQFIVTLSGGGYNSVYWTVNGVDKGSAQDITIRAEDYFTGTYRLTVTAEKNGVPYSAQITFTVTN
jgi:hypothetical protein